MFDGTAKEYPIKEPVLDEIAVFNTVKNATEVNSLYGSGNPPEITGATNYYRLGEEANFTDILS